MAFLSYRIFCNSSCGWLIGSFLFGTEIGEGQLKKSPCTYPQLASLHHSNESELQTRDGQMLVRAVKPISKGEEVTPNDPLMTFNDFWRLSHDHQPTQVSCLMAFNDS